MTLDEIKEMYDWINKNLNSHDFYDIKESEDDPNLLYLVWKGTDKAFCSLDKSKVKETIDEEKRQWRKITNESR